MAFPIPSHLPRKRDNDISTQLLNKLSEATSSTLSFELASSWVSELDGAILDTKKRLHERIHADFPAFEQQLSSAKSVQERLRNLSSNVDVLDKTLSDPESGMISNLIMSLTKHASLAQDVLDSDVNFGAVEYLSQCKRHLEALSELENNGKLPEAVKSSNKLDIFLNTIPVPLDTSKVMIDFKRRYRILKDRIQEQLNEAYSRSVRISATEIVIRSSVPVRQSQTILSLSDILVSLSSVSLDSHISVLRRDLTTHYIDYILKQPTSIVLSLTPNSGSNVGEHKLTLFRAPPSEEILSTRIENITTVLTFLNESLFPHLPESLSFPQSLCKALTSAFLDRLLIPTLPTSMAQLPEFLALTQQAAEFERRYIVELLGDNSPERKVKSWADTVGAHYEKRRRVDLLERARNLVLRHVNDKETFVAELTSVDEPEPSPIGPQAILTESTPPPVEAPIVDQVSWDFEDSDNADGWGLDDDLEPEDPVVDSQPEPMDVEPEAAETEDDPGDAWGWNDDSAPPDGDGDASTDSSAWDDPWADTDTVVEPQPVKPVTKLEKFTNGKTKASKAPPTLQSPTPLAVPPPTPAMPPPPSGQPITLEVRKRKVVETYVVSGRMRELVALIDDVLREASDLASSGVLSAFRPTTPTGNVIRQVASLSLDLYRALYPVAFAKQLKTSPKTSCRLSNDCWWLSEQIPVVASRCDGQASIQSELEECANRLKVFGESWFQDIIDNQCQHVHNVLDDAQGFVRTHEQDRFDQCEEAVNGVLQDVRRFGQQVKPIIVKSKYYTALGSIVDSALSRILRDVLALPDITAVESHKLSELCRILTALEALFVEGEEQASFVVAYVPSWLKFSYLSELMEASIADISYLFDEGDLVDFEIEELVKLVQALFADTPLRTNTINKLMQGHPVISS